VVEATDAESAIDEALRVYGINEPWQRGWLKWLGAFGDG
jgi:hypothetical protein